MAKTGRSPAHKLRSLRQQGLDSVAARGTSSCGETLIPPGFTSVHTPVAPLLPFRSFFQSLSLRSIHPSIHPASSSLQEQIRLQTNFLSMSAHVPWSSASPPAQETEEERTEAVRAPPSLHPQAACASTRSSSSSSFAGIGMWKTGGGEEGEEGWTNEKRGEGPGSGGWSQPKDSFCVMVTQGRRRDGATLLCMKQHVCPSACSRSSRFLTARLPLLHTARQREISPAGRGRGQGGNTAPYHRGAEGREGPIPPYALILDNKFMLERVTGTPREPEVHAHYWHDLLFKGLFAGPFHLITNHGDR